MHAVSSGQKVQPSQEKYVAKVPAYKAPTHVLREYKIERNWREACQTTKLTKVWERQKPSFRHYKRGRSPNLLETNPNRSITTTLEPRKTVSVK